MLKHESIHILFTKTLIKNKKKILEIPMPSVSRFNVPIWHTIGFMFGFDFLKTTNNEIYE